LQTSNFLLPSLTRLIWTKFYYNK